MCCDYRLEFRDCLAKSVSSDLKIPDVALLLRRRHIASPQQTRMTLMKFPGLIAAMALLAGCASSEMVPVYIESNPPGAQIEVNGISFGAAPVKAELACSKRWVGVVNAPGGWSYDRALYEITANPTSETPGIVQTKNINACDIKSPPAHMRFDMAIEKVAPRQKVDVNITNSSGLEGTLKSLRSLRDQGLLTEQEYRAKVDQAVNGN